MLNITYRLDAKLPPRTTKRLIPKALRVCARFCFHAFGFVCIGNTFCTVLGINFFNHLYNERIQEILCFFAGYPASVDGSSMKPTINEERSFCSDWVFVNCWSAKNFNLSRGEIVVFNSPVGNKFVLFS